MELNGTIYQWLLTCRSNINDYCSGREPWEIIFYTVIAMIVLFFMMSCLQDMHDDGLYHFWRFLRSLPFIKQSIQKKMDSSSREIENQLQKGLENKVFIKNIPEKSWTCDDIVKELNQYLGFGHFAYNEGYVSGAVYSGNNQELYELMKKVYGATSYTNPLHPDVFPGIRVMEAEIVHMVASLFHAPTPIGTVTTGGTESIFLVCKAYRDFARFEKGVKTPNMVIPITAHAAFDKAAQMLKIKVKHIKFDPKTSKVNIGAMKKAIDRDTCMIVGSAPAFPHGSIDDIEAIGRLGCKNGVPVHVDACLGGFLIPFMDEAGHSIPPFDFRVPGVTSISVDTHKYAYAPKGSSVILYKNKIHRHYQFSVQPDWPGGIYGTPNLGGSRSGGVIATCWSALLFHGRETYVESTRKIIDVTKYIEEGLRKIPHIHIIGKPEVSVVAVGTNYFDIYRLSGALTEKGWNLNVLQFPSGFHFCVTLQHTREGVADKFLKDVQDCVEEIMLKPNLPTTGTAAIYGMSQQIPDRSLVSELVWAYLDACYSIKTKS